MTVPDESRYWVVSGRVQGVGFRWFVARHAERAGILGWVRNTVDGQVEVVAIGSVRQLEDMERQLWIGPSLSDVENVENISKQINIDSVKSFDIR